MLAKTKWVDLLLDVDFQEVLGLLSTLKWIRDLQLGLVDFEIELVDSLYGSKNGVFNWSALINDCSCLVASYLATSDVRFIRRQANKFVHSLARTASCHAGFCIQIKIPSCISIIIIHEMQFCLITDLNNTIKKTKL